MLLSIRKLDLIKLHFHYDLSPQHNVVACPLPKKYKKTLLDISLLGYLEYSYYA